MTNLFGTLNRFIARLDSDPQNPPTTTTTTKGGINTANTYGFQILRNTNPSLPLDPWFDFIIGLNGHNLDSSDPNLFATEIRNCAGSNISLGIYSVKGQQIREIYVQIPHDASSGLGLSLQWSPLSVGDDVWHILDVMPNSPADVAGLLPYGDYVVGTPEGVLRGEAALGQLVESFRGAPLRLFVYNHEYDVTRLVTITPTKDWGGDGALGCVLGYGALHRVPAPLTEPAQGPGETLFESGNGNDYTLDDADPTLLGSQGGPDFLVPAEMQMPSTSPPPPSIGSGGPPTGKARKQRAHHAATPAAGLDDYFAEGEQKSRELDKGSTPKPTGSLPPPPKAGTPKPTSPAPGTK